MQVLRDFLRGLNGQTSDSNFKRFSADVIEVSQNWEVLLAQTELRVEDFVSFLGGQGCKQFCLFDNARFYLETQQLRFENLIYPLVFGAYARDSPFCSQSCSRNGVPLAAYDVCRHSRLIGKSIGEAVQNYCDIHFHDFPLTDPYLNEFLHRVIDRRAEHLFQKRKIA